MFHVLTITYRQSLDAVAAVRPAHVEWVRVEVDAGRLILAGRLASDGGGILITADLDADDVDRLIARDPYLLADVARYERIGFDATLRAPWL